MLYLGFNRFLTVRATLWQSNYAVTSEVLMCFPNIVTYVADRKSVV